MTCPNVSTTPALQTCPLFFLHFFLPFFFETGSLSVKNSPSRYLPASSLTSFLDPSENFSLCTHPHVPDSPLSNSFLSQTMGCFPDNRKQRAAFGGETWLTVGVQHVPVILESATSQIKALLLQLLPWRCPS